MNDISTSFTEPANYLPAVRDAVVYVREEWDTPQKNIYRLDMEKWPHWIEKCNDSVEKLYMKLAAMANFEKIMCGMWIYHIDMLLPFARNAGMYEELCDKYNFWEPHPKVLDFYPKMLETAEKAVPKAFAGLGWPPVPEERYKREYGGKVGGGICQ